MRIGEMARRLGLAPETLRYYERLGLLPSPARNGGRYREYSDEDAERLRLLVGLRQLDLPLSIAAKLATMCADGRCGEVSDELRAAIPVERSKVRRRIRELRHVDDRLALLERELRAGQGPRELIRLEPRKEEH
jgi:DNA-binding transcriptional MerR regulator